MPLILNEGRAIFFAHVPKTGGSSVEDYLIRRFGSPTLLDRHKRRGVRGTGLITPVTHLSALDLEELLPGRLDLCFAVVRDPLDRALSEYRYQSGVSRMSRLGFSTWLRVMAAAVRREPRVYENHVRPQSDLVPEGAEIFRLEDGFDGMIARLDAVTGTTAPELSVGHLLKRERRPIALRREDAALVAELYAADYARFGYAQPDAAALSSDRRAGLRAALAAPLARTLVAKQRRDWTR